MTPSPDSAETPEEQELKKLKNQVDILNMQIELDKAKQTLANAASAEQTAILTALTTQANAQKELDKAKAQGDFAKLEGIKAGLASVGAPVGKEGNITISTGTAGTLMLGLKTPMFEGLGESAAIIAEAVEKKLPVYIGTDTQVESALKAGFTKKILEQETEALKESIDKLEQKTEALKESNDKLKGEGQQKKQVSQMSLKGAGADVAAVTGMAPAVAAVAATELALDTLAGFGKFFRVDTAYSVFDASDEAQQTLVSMVAQKLGAKGDCRNLATVSVDEILKQAESAQTLLRNLKAQYERGTAIDVEISKLKADDQNRPPQNLIDRLRFDLAVAKTMLNSLMEKPDDFWDYVKMLAANALMQDSGKYINCLVVSVKTQTIQIVKKRTWRSDEIDGRSDMHVEYRLLDPAGKLLDYGLNLATYSKPKCLFHKPAEKLRYRFPTDKTAP